MKHLFTISLIFIFTSALFSQVKYVPTDYRTIQTAIETADSGDVIIVEEGRYFEQINFLGKAITVTSEFYLDRDTLHITNTIIDGSFFDNDSSSIVYFINGEDSTSVLSSLTLQNGKGTRMSDNELVGGAILLDCAGATISHNIIKNNSAVDEKYLLSEQNAFGAGIECVHLPQDKSLIVSNNDFYNNDLQGYRAMGGGIDVYWTKGRVKISQNKFIKNRVNAKKSGYGGGVNICGAHNDSKIYIDNNYISSNTTYSLEGFSKGGGIACYFSAPIIRNNVIVYNSTNYPQNYAHAAFGGGIAVHWYKNPRWFDQFKEICDPYNFVVIIENNTIAYNNDKIAGGGIALRSVGARLKNNIIGCNFAENDQQIKVEFLDAPETETRKVIMEYSNIEGGFEGEGNINDFPEFTDEEKWYLKRDLSPCIDAGDPQKEYEDVQDPTRSGTAYFPALGTVRNDMGAFGGPHSKWQDSLMTNVEEGFVMLPEKPELYQNYPNPFNPSTKIKYNIPDKIRNEELLVQLKIYDVLGREITTLINVVQKPGSYEITWNAGDNSSGVYFYKIMAGDFVETKKMLLMK